jgi:tetratricopeptide (TPR) repeat protein
MRIGSTINLLLSTMMFVVVITIMANSAEAENISFMNESTNRSDSHNTEMIRSVELEPIDEINETIKNITIGFWGPYIENLFKNKKYYAKQYLDQGNKNYYVENYPIALENYNRSIECYPLPEAWYNKGNALYKLGKCEDASNAYEKAIELKSPYEKARKNKEKILPCLIG